MATVKERFEHLGFAHNNKILMVVGIEVGEKFMKEYGELGDYRKKKTQQEGETEFTVWDYPEFWVKDLDRIIINYLEHYLEVK